MSWIEFCLVGSAGRLTDGAAITAVTLTLSVGPPMIVTPFEPQSNFASNGVIHLDVTFSIITNSGVRRGALPRAALA